MVMSVCVYTHVNVYAKVCVYRHEDIWYFSVWVYTCECIRLSMSVRAYAHVSVGACGGQRCQTLCTEGTGEVTVSHTVWVLGIKLGSSAGATSAFKC